MMRFIPSSPATEHAEKGRLQSLLPLYAAGIGLGGIVAHFASEFAGMGSAANAVALSPRHLYLSFLAVLFAAVAWREVAKLLFGAKGHRDVQQALRLGFETLPLRGRGWFLPLTAALQFAVSQATEFGEGCPLCGHDVTAGLIGALVTSIVIVILWRAVGRRLPRMAALIVIFLAVEGDAHRGVYVCRYAAGNPLALAAWPHQLFSRPPPLPIA